MIREGNIKWIQLASTDNNDKSTYMLMLEKRGIQVPLSRYREQEYASDWNLEDRDIIDKILRPKCYKMTLKRPPLRVEVLLQRGKRKRWCTKEEQGQPLYECGNTLTIPRHVHTFKGSFLSLPDGLIRPLLFKVSRDTSSPSWNPAASMCFRLTGTYLGNPACMPCQ